MNCPTADKLSQFVDNLLVEQEQSDINTHLKSCNECRRIVEAFKDEQQFLRETLQTPTLPDDFDSLVLDQLEPYKQKAVRRKRTPWKRIILSAAVVVVAIGLSAALNPSFAQWIGGLFSTEQVDEGLRMAKDAGLVQRVNQEVTNNGITFKVEDVITDSSRVALSYQIINTDGKLQDTQLDIDVLQDSIMAFDQNGKRIEHIGMGWSEGSDYGLIEISLREQPTVEAMTVKFNFDELNGVKGNWKLEIPINLKEARQVTISLPLNDKNSNKHGININMTEFRFSPSSSEFLYETTFTEEEQVKVKDEVQKLETKFGEEKVTGATNYGTAISYHIENEEGKAIYHHNHNTFFEDEAYSHGSGQLQSSSFDMEQLGQIAWNDSFIPQKDKQKLTFVLDGVFKTVPSDFSIKIKPNDLKKNPVSFEYEGNFITIKKAKKENDYSLRKSLMPIEKETSFIIEMEGGREATASELGDWVLVDDKGKTYSTYGGGSILNEKDKNGRYKTSINLKSYDLEEIPEELTLHLLSVTRYNEVKDKWKVPLY
ncbi:DUF4179 domain-containing protein [Bacillus sp. FJAT-49705]|uniref:DUF4179 domain-containing protein n=1 Tax=Cytobacillus citreus TaxID=2833586 RepID=A0ABS5NWI2_9BACI|nr:DUF4179 domain-containing protein [Cytobacillus citreus]MBS4191946.1 DUF4179 domain-containing protein [Cytobacillus citreus]